MKSRIHVNQHIIKANKKTGAREPVVTVKTYKNNTKTNEASILCRCGCEAAKVIYSPDNPLSCGATVWVETELEVVST